MLGQILRFGLTGFINTVIDYGLFNLLVICTGITAGWELGLINLAAVSAASLNSYFWNRNFTFQARSESPRRQGPRFIAATTGGLIINSMGVVVFSALLNSLALPSGYVLNLGKILASFLSISWNFFSYRQWVFAKDSSSTVAISRPDMVPGLTSVIIPAFNESLRLPARLEELALNLPRYFPVEIIVVDDGSSDSSPEIAENMAQQYPFISCYSYSPNRGKGYAVKTGINASRGEFLIFVDADSSFTPVHIRKVAGRLHQGSPLVIACRRSSMQRAGNGEPGLRLFMSRVFNGLVQSLLLPGIKDSQCGLKGFSREAAREIFSRQRLRRFAFDVELLALARALKIGIEEIPVVIDHCPGSRVSYLWAPLQMGFDIMKVKFALMSNSYRIPGGNRILRQAALATGLLAAALAVRLPWLWEIPRFIDELKEVNLAYLIYSGQAWPLHNAAHDIGALHNYILAAIFHLLGPSIIWPRLYVASISALTVLLAFYLGRSLYGNMAGLLAAGFLLANGMNILTSHMAWSNSTTPFFFILALILTIKAEKEKNGLRMVEAALCWAAALQTHSSVLIYIGIVLVYCLRPRFRRETGISGRWYLFSALALMAGYANMIYYNLLSGGGSFLWLKNKGYALEQQLTPFSYLANLEQMVIELLRTLSSTYSGHQHLWQYIGEPLFLLSLLLLAAGCRLVWNKENGASLPLWLMAGTIILMPLINQRYVFYLSTRYIMPVVICAMLLMAYAIQCLWQKATERKAVLHPASPAFAAGLLLLLALQLLPFYRYCERIENTNESNRMALSILNGSQTITKSQNGLVLLDATLPLENTPLPSLLTLEGSRYQVLNSNTDTAWQQALDTYKGRYTLAVISEPTYQQIKSFIEPEKVTCLSCQVSIPAPSPNKRLVYLLQWSR